MASRRAGRIIESGLNLPSEDRFAGSHSGQLHAQDQLAANRHGVLLGAPSWHLQGENRMVRGISLLSLVVGATLTYFAGRAPAHVEVLETIDAAMLIAGLALAGSALPVIPLKKQR
jgi:hypothetical protein